MLNYRTHYLSEIDEEVVLLRCSSLLQNLLLNSHIGNEACITGMLSAVVCRSLNQAPVPGVQNVVRGAGFQGRGEGFAAVYTLSPL